MMSIDSLMGCTVIIFIVEGVSSLADLDPNPLKSHIRIIGLSWSIDSAIDQIALNPRFNASYNTPYDNKLTLASSRAQHEHSKAQLYEKSFTARLDYGHNDLQKKQA